MQKSKSFLALFLGSLIGAMIGPVIYSQSINIASGTGGNVSAGTLTAGIIPVASGSNTIADGSLSDNGSGLIGVSLAGANQSGIEVPGAGVLNLWAKNTKPVVMDGTTIAFANQVTTLATLTSTGAATGKKVVCVDTATGRLYASSTGTDCSN